MTPTSESTALRAWTAVLDAIETQLSATGTALAAGAAPPRPPDLVFPTETLAGELADRARALVELVEHVQWTADQRLSQLRAALRRLPARRPSPRRAYRGNIVDVGA